MSGTKFKKQYIDKIHEMTYRACMFDSQRISLVVHADVTYPLTKKLPSAEVSKQDCLAYRLLRRRTIRDHHHGHHRRRGNHHRESLSREQPARELLAREVPAPALGHEILKGNKYVIS